MKQMAIIREVQCGVGDRGRFALWFSTYVGDNEAALQVIESPDVAAFVESYGVRDIRQLDGRPCWVEVGPGTIRYVGPCKAGAK